MESAYHMMSLPIIPEHDSDGLCHKQSHCCTLEANEADVKMTVSGTTNNTRHGILTPDIVRSPMLKGRTSRRTRIITATICFIIGSAGCSKSLWTNMSTLAAPTSTIGA